MSLNLGDRETLTLLVNLCAPFGFTPMMSLESRKFFQDLLSEYHGPPEKESLSRWLKEQISKAFVALGKWPEWIQSPEWPFADGKPMIFVGQIDISVAPGGTASHMFHDDTSFYLFMPVGEGQFEVIMQQF